MQGFLTEIEVITEAVSSSEYSASDTLLSMAMQQLYDYFQGKRVSFSLPYRADGTEYRQKVWGALIEILPGSTETYSHLAYRLGTGPRAVASACRANPLPIVVPCHRVIGTRGIGGYNGQRGGRYLEIKSWLLEHESHLASQTNPLF